MSQSRRTPLLAAALAVVTLLVVLDRTGALAKLRPSTGADGPLARYTRAAAEAGSRDRFLADAPRWDAALAEAQDAAAMLGRAAVKAETEQIAAATARNLILDVINRVKVDGVNVARTTSAPPRAAPPPSSSPSPKTAQPTGISILTFDVSFDARTQSDAITIIDALESLRDARTRIAELTVRGPGAMQIAGAPIAVNLRLDVLAIVGGEASP